MAKGHLKRFATPTTWGIKRKGIKFITRPKPGAHPRQFSIPINIVLKDIIKCAKTTKEARKLLYANEILVDGRRVKDHRFPVGLLDVINIKQTNQFFRIVFDKRGNLSAIETDADDAKSKICRVTGKSLLKGGKMQLNLSDSRNIIAEKDSCKVGESIMIEVPSQKIAGQFKLEKGSAILLMSGKHIADIGIVEKAGKYVVIYKDGEGNTHTTSRKYAFVVGKEKPAIKIN